VTRTPLRLVLGIGLTAIGALALREAWWPAALGYGALLLGLAVLMVVAWRWLERDRDRLLRWSNEPRAAGLSRARRPDGRPVPGPSAAGPVPPLPAVVGGPRPARVEPVAARPPGPDSDPALVRPVPARPAPAEVPARPPAPGPGPDPFDSSRA
jgi:hypothetical protein